jgi:uncharacterized protein YndB with AHSA1/START domain
MRFSNTITIDRNPDAVFGYLADLENLPEWNYAIQQTRKVTADPVGAGSRYLQTRTIPVHRQEGLEVIEFDPDRSLTLRGSLNSFRALISYTLRPDGNTTALTNTVDLQPPRTLNLLAPIATHRIQSAVAANLNVLKRTLEQS